MKDGFQAIFGTSLWPLGPPPIQETMRNKLAQLNSSHSLKCSQEEETCNSGYVVGGKIVRKNLHTKMLFQGFSIQTNSIMHILKNFNLNLILYR